MTFTSPTVKYQKKIALTIFATDESGLRKKPALLREMVVYLN